MPCAAATSPGPPVVERTWVEISVRVRRPRSPRRNDAARYRVGPWNAKAPGCWGASGPPARISVGRGSLGSILAAARKAWSAVFSSPLTKAAAPLRNSAWAGDSGGLHFLERERGHATSPQRQQLSDSETKTPTAVVTAAGVKIQDYRLVERINRGDGASGPSP